MAATPSPSFLRSLLASAGQWALIVLLTLGVGEAVARWGCGIRPLTTESLVWTDHPRWGWFHQPNAEDSFVKPGFAQEIHINSRGLREREIPYAKPDGEFRILVIGDSSVVSFEVPPEAVFTRVAEDRLRKAGYPVRFINGGVRGWGTDQALLFLEEEGLKYAPDLVLYKWTNNDRENNVTIHRPFRKYGKSWFVLDDEGGLTLRGVPVPRYPYRSDLRAGPDGEPVESPVAWRAAATFWLRDHVLCRSSFGTGLLKLAFSLPGADESLVKLGEDRGERKADRTLDRGSYSFRLAVALVERMDRSSQAAGAGFRMITSGTGLEYALLEDAGVPPLGEGPLWRSRIPSDRPIQMPYDPHWNELGHRLYGEALAEALEASGLLPPPEAG